MTHVLTTGIANRESFSNIAIKCKTPPKRLVSTLLELYDMNEIISYFYETISYDINNRILRFNENVLSDKLMCSYYFKEASKPLYSQYPLLGDMLKRVLELINHDIDTFVLKPVPPGEIYLWKEIRQGIQNNELLGDYLQAYRDHYPNKYFGKHFFRVLEDELDEDELKNYYIYQIETAVANQHPQLNINLFDTWVKLIFNYTTVKKDWLKKRPAIILLQEVLDELSSKSFQTLRKQLTICINDVEPINMVISIYEEPYNLARLIDIDSFIAASYSDSIIKNYIKATILKKIELSKVNRKLSMELFFNRDDSDAVRYRYPKFLKLFEQSLVEIKDEYNLVLFHNFGVKSSKVDAFMQKVSTIILSINSLSEAQILSKANDVLLAFKNNREKLSRVSFYRAFLDVGNELEYIGQIEYRLRYLSCFTQIDDAVKVAMADQKNYLILSNGNESSLKAPFWKWYFLEGENINSKSFRFDSISSDIVVNELKMYLIANYKPKRVVRLYTHLNNAKRGLVLLEKHFNIVSLKDIKIHHVHHLVNALQLESSLSPKSINATLSALGLITKFLMNLEHYQHKPATNSFDYVELKNLDAMSKNTVIIPEEVILAIEEHIEDVNETFQLMFRLLKSTGFRANEFVLLPYNCCDTEVKDGFVRLNYIPRKILSARRKKSLPDMSFVYIEENLASEISLYVEKTMAIRRKYNSEFLFIKEQDGDIKTYTGDGFVQAINRIIERYNITHNGKKWIYSARQSRKRLAVDMVEAGATNHEIAAQLGHLKIATSDKYYKEVQRKKLAELNTAFYEEKFGLHIDDKTLNLYSEEERRLLYVDFCLNVREVEFGQCTKHLSEGACGKRIGKANCANCNKLCTGIKYVDKWEALAASEKAHFDALEELYLENGIPIEEYSAFKEYRNTKYRYESYKNTIMQIRS